LDDVDDRNDDKDYDDDDDCDDGRDKDGDYVFNDNDVAGDDN